jgi:hypothetical protein
MQRLFFKQRIYVNFICRRSGDSEKLLYIFCVWIEVLSGV